MITVGESPHVSQGRENPQGDFAYSLSVKFLYRDNKNKKYVGRTAIDITDLKRTEKDLQRKQDLLRSLIEVQEKEKQFLYHEFHDGLIQYAVGSLRLLEADQVSIPDASEASVMIEKLIEYLRTGVEDGRRVIRGVRPALLDDSGLEAAIDDLVEQYSQSGMVVTSHCDPQFGRLPETIQTTAYHVVQEALNNAKKYSGTDVVRIELKQGSGDLQLEVRDFGSGFDVESAGKNGFGLLSMTERVRLLGGECRIQIEKDVGTSISIRLLPPPSDSEHN